MWRKNTPVDGGTIINLGIKHGKEGSWKILNSKGELVYPIIEGLETGDKKLPAGTYLIEFSNNETKITKKLQINSEEGEFVE